jgi:hypothetical protein
MVVMAVAVANLAACATTVPPTTPEQAVKERAQARWDALVKSDLKSAYGFFSPGSRAVNSYEGWTGSIKQGFWKSAVVDKVTCATPDNCSVAATIEYEFSGRRAKTPVAETWIREGSDWWYVQK